MTTSFTVATLLSVACFWSAIAGKAAKARTKAIDSIKNHRLFFLPIKNSPFAFCETRRAYTGPNILGRLLPYPKTNKGYRERRGELETWRCCSGKFTLNVGFFHSVPYRTYLVGGHSIAIVGRTINPVVSRA